MKQSLLIVLILLLCGCTSMKHSFEKGSIDMDQLYANIMEVSAEHHWRYAPLQDTNWTQSEIEKTYHLDMTKVEEAVVRSSVMLSDVSEIAFFKVSEDNESYVIKAIEHRRDEVKQIWEPYKGNATYIIDSAKHGRIGQYYYFILGEDSKKVVNYIQQQE